MRWLIAALLLCWSLLTAFAYVVVLPDERQDEQLILAFADAGSSGEGPAGVLWHKFLDSPACRTALGPEAAQADVDVARLAASVLASPSDSRPRAALLSAFRSWYQAEVGTSLAQTPTLIWSTDDNPARRTQCHLFRVWHLRTFGTPVDIRTDPSNRDTTKTIVQCVAGAGPDLIEAYGPAQLEQFVSAGVALDVTDVAKTEGFDESKVFPAAVSSISMGGKQYAFPCNVGYTVLFYHRDMFEQAAAQPPPATGGWTLAQMLDSAKKLTAMPSEGGRRRVGVMGLGAWNMALADGTTFFAEGGVASFYNRPETVRAFKDYLDLMYVHKVMPTPAELASMAASGGANMNMGAEAASASALFAAKVAAMITDGRWTYVALAQRQRDRVIKPAMERRIAALAATDDEASRRERDELAQAIKSLDSDVLVPISDEQFALMEACLTPDDRARLLQLGVAHVPTSGGTPWYEAAARVAIVNRASANSQYAVRFLRFLASDEYNNQINFTFDSISGTPEIIKRNGISGKPRPLPGLEAFGSPVFVEAMDLYAHPWELSPFIGRNRLGQLVGPVMEQLTNNVVGPAEAARLIESRINDQIHANLVRDAELRAQWEKAVGATFDPSKGIREQVEAARPARVSEAPARAPSAPARAPRAVPAGHPGRRAAA